MIDPDDYYKQKKFYLKDNKCWKVVSFCPEPSITMGCVGTGEQLNFGVSGLINKEFKEMNAEER